MQLMQTTSSSSETSLVPLRFGVDTRTNSVIASGTMADLNIVEAILTKLDDGEVRHRKSVVIRLKNSPATDVADDDQPVPHHGAADPAAGRAGADQRLRADRARSGRRRRNRSPTAWC